MATKKVYGPEVLWNTVEAFPSKNLKILAEAAKYNKVAQIIATLKIYCTKEVEKQQRLSAPKDLKAPTKLVFDPGEDLRDNTITRKAKRKRSLWEFINGKEDSIR